MDFNANGGPYTEDTATDGRVRMPFGKHRGRPLEEIPDSYLLWALDKMTVLDNRPALKEAIRERLGFNRPKGNTDLEAVVKEWYRRLAMDFHPDRRKGSSEAMIAVNEAHDRIRKMLRL